MPIAWCVLLLLCDNVWGLCWSEFVDKADREGLGNKEKERNRKRIKDVYGCKCEI